MSEVALAQSEDAGAKAGMTSAVGGEGSTAELVTAPGEELVGRMLARAMLTTVPSEAVSFVEEGASQAVEEPGRPEPFRLPGAPRSPPESVRRARLGLDTLPGVARPRPLPINGQAATARLQRLMVEHAGEATNRSPTDLPSVAADRAAAMYQRMDLTKPPGGIRDTLRERGREQEGPVRDNFTPKVGATLEQVQMLRQLAKEPQLPLNHQPERRLGGPTGPEVRPEDVDYDLHVVNRLPHLSEREGRPLFPGGSSFAFQDRELSSQQLLDKFQADMLSLARAYVSLAQEREAAREEELWQASYQDGFRDGGAAVERVDFETVHRLEAEAARLRTRACEADTLADQATRERDAQAHHAAEAEARAEQQKQANEHLIQSALLEAQTEVQGQVEALKQELWEAEEFARRAERDHADAARVVEVLSDRVGELEASSEEGWRVAHKHQAEAETLQKKVSELQEGVARLQGKLTESESALGRTGDELLAAKEQAEVARAELEAALKRAEAAEARPNEVRVVPASAAEVGGISLAVDSGGAAVESAREVPASGEATAALTLRVQELLLETEELRRTLEVVRTSAAERVREAEVREIFGSIDMYNAALEVIHDEHPYLDLRRHFMPLPDPSSLPRLDQPSSLPRPDQPTSPSPGPSLQGGNEP